MFSGVDKFISRHPIFRARKKMGASNQSARPIKTQVEILLFVRYYLISTYSFHF